MTVITLLTDFGMQDGYMGVMKGVIYGIAPAAEIVDISHSIPPQNVSEGCLVLSRAYRYFPAGTIHVAVIDPGVGTNRRPIAGLIGDHFFVCPDNGLLTRIREEAQANGWPVKLIHLNQSRYWLAQVSNVFHGRDIFAPAAAHLAAGTPLENMGIPIHDPVLLHLPHPHKKPEGWQAEIIYIDRFGNLSTNLTFSYLDLNKDIRVRAGGKEISHLSTTFGDEKPGTWMALMGADGELMIAVVNGSAARESGAQVGDRVDVFWGAG